MKKLQTTYKNVVTCEQKHMDGEDFIVVGFMGKQYTVPRPVPTFTYLDAVAQCPILMPDVSECNFKLMPTSIAIHFN